MNTDHQLARRLASLPEVTVGGVRARVATGYRVRLLGLAFLTPARACNLLIPGCRAVHTWGMRFAVRVVFLDRSGYELRRIILEPGRLASEQGASAVLEIPLGRSERFDREGLADAA